MRPGGKSNGESPFFEKPIFCRLRNRSGVCIAESGGLRCKDESSRGGSGRSRFNMTHTPERGAAARKSQRVTRIAGVEKFVGSRFTPTCSGSDRLKVPRDLADRPNAEV